MITFTPEEIEWMRTCPQAVESAMNYNSVQATLADARDFCPKFHDDRYAELKEFLTLIKKAEDSGNEEDYEALKR